MSEQEKKDKKFGLIASGIIHASLVLVFLLLVAWREPDPPIPEYGIELNLGFQEEGSGDTERENEALVEDTAEEELPDATEETEQEESAEEEVVEEATPPETVTKTDPQETKEVKEEVKEVVKDPVTTEKSEVVVEEKKEETQEKKEEEAVEKKEAEQPPVEKPKPKVDNRALMGGKKTDSASTEQSSNNQGDQRGLMGNQGSKDGNKDTQGQADADGLSYSLEGWSLVGRKIERDDSQVGGKMVFTIEVDDRGIVRRAYLKPGAGSSIGDQNIVAFYQRQIMKFTFEPKDQSRIFNGVSKGTVTIVIKNN